MRDTGIIILAAGNSSRLGRPKQLLSYEGKSLLQRTIDHALENPTHQVVVVLGALQHDNITEALHQPRVRTVINDNWASGMASSINAGLRALLIDYPDMDRCIIGVCDQPMVTAPLFEELKELADQTKKGIVATGYSETWGVPVVFDRHYFNQLLTLDNPNGAKGLIQQHTDDLAIFSYEPARMDIDTMADYCQLSHQMVSVDEAHAIIDFHLPAPAISKDIPLSQVLGYTLASDVIATLSIPGFEQSSMDGYAIRYADKNMELNVVDTIPAGSTTAKEIGAGQAMRIFTGAPLPNGADTVVMQEKIERDDRGTIVINDHELHEGSHVRPKGSEVGKGAVAIQKGIHLSPPVMGYLAGIGCTHVDIYTPPRVALILTGDELKPLGTSLRFGEVYESNSLQLTAALKQLGIGEVECHHVRDDIVQLKDVIEKQMESADILLLVGGVSVGDYDFVTKAATDCGVKQRFHRIRQKPGKPLFFGTYGEKLVFGLPGNPSSALTCFYLYVAPVLERLMKLPQKTRAINAVASCDYQKKPGLTHFLKAWYDGKTVTPLHAQESYRLQSYAQANCLLILDEASTGCKVGEEVKIFLL